MLAPKGCQNQKLAAIHCLTVLEAGGLKSMWQQDHAFSAGSKRAPFLASSRFWDVSTILDVLGFTDISLRLHGFFSLCDFTSSSLCACLSLCLNSPFV